MRRSVAAYCSIAIACCSSCVSSSAKFEGPDAPIACRKLRQPSASTANRPEAFGLLSVAIGILESTLQDAQGHRVKHPAGVLLNEATHSHPQPAGLYHDTEVLPPSTYGANVVHICCNVRWCGLVGGIWTFSPSAWPLALIHCAPRHKSVKDVAGKVRRCVGDAHMAARELPAAYRLHAAHCTEIAAHTADTENKLTLSQHGPRVAATG